MTVARELERTLTAGGLGPSDSDELSSRPLRLCGSRSDTRDTVLSTPFMTPSVVPSVRATACGLLCAALLMGVIARPAAGAPVRVREPAPRPSTVSRLGATTPLSAGGSAALAARPLIEQLQLLLGPVLLSVAQGPAVTVRLQVGDSYPLAPGLESQPIPIALMPPSRVAVPGDWSPGAVCQEEGEDSVSLCAVAGVIRNWFASHRSAGGDGQLMFDLEVWPGSLTAPPVRMSGLTVRCADISDLSC